MTESTVQVPVSLIRRVAHILEYIALMPNTARRLRALLSQPTPPSDSLIQVMLNAVEPLTDQQEALRNERASERRERNARIFNEPPRIEDMAPGATFRINEDEDDEIWTVRENRIAVCSTHGVGRYLDAFDPSTIRDVTPPAGE